MIFDREVTVFVALLALCAMLVLMILHITEVIAAPQIKCEATPPKVNSYINWRLIDGRRCYYVGRRIDKGLLYWEPEKPLEIEEMPLPVEAPAIRAQDTEFEDRWNAQFDHRTTRDPLPLQQWRMWE
jgi:hypothetical protein